MIKGSSIENTGNSDIAGNTWNQTYGGVGNESARAFIQTVDGGFALVGTTHFFGYDIWLVKTDRNGIMLWNKTFGTLWYYTKDAR